MFEFKKPEGFIYLSTLNPNYNSLEIALKSYKSEEDANNDKNEGLKNPFSLSGSKAKQLVIDPYARYKEVVLGENPYINEEVKSRMKYGSDLEDWIVYQRIKPEYENNSLWEDKIIVIDKRRRYVKNMPWISYELDLLVYKLNKNRKDYSGFESDGNIYNNDFVINNTSGAFDDFLSKQIKYAIYDIKVSQLDVVENFDNYDCQLNIYGYFENVEKVGIFNWYKNIKLEELVKDRDASIIIKIFNSYDNFIIGLENGYTFEKEKIDGVCTELPKETIEDENILNNIISGFKLFPKYNLQYKKAETELKLIKDYIKLYLPIITKQEKYNIVLPISDDGKQHISYYTTKVSSKKEINTKELIKFFYNNNIKKVKTKDGIELDFDLENFMYEKITGGIPMFRLVINEKVEIDKELEKIFKGDIYDI